MEEYRKAAQKLDDRNVWRWLLDKINAELQDPVVRRFLVNMALISSVFVGAGLCAAIILWLIETMDWFGAVVSLVLLMMGIATAITYADIRRGL